LPSPTQTERHRGAANAHTRLAWIDSLRWVAAAAVVWQHALSTAARTAIGTGHVTPAWIVNSLLMFPVPVFFFLSGYVHALSSRSPAKLIPHTMLRTAIPYLAWSSIYMAFAVTTGRFVWPGFSGGLVDILTARLAPHLWFLASLTLVAPIGAVLWLLLGRRTVILVLPVALVTSLWYSYSMVLHSPMSTLSRMLIIPLGLYVSGMWLARDELPERWRGLGQRVLLPTAVLLLCAGAVEAYFAVFVTSPPWTVAQPTSLLVGAALLCIAASTWRSDGAAVACLASLPRVTLGVYCIHLLTLQVIRSAIPPYGSGLLIGSAEAVVCLLISSLIAYAISQVPIARRIVC